MKAKEFKKIQAILAGAKKGCSGATKLARFHKARFHKARKVASKLAKKIANLKCATRAPIKRRM